MNLRPEIILFSMCQFNPSWPRLSKEVLFHPVRKWRFDFAFVDTKVAIEIEGIHYQGAGTRHQRGKGYEEDMDKYNEATAEGWCVLRFSPKIMNENLDKVEDQIKRTLKLRRE